MRINHVMCPHCGQKHDSSIMPGNPMDSPEPGDANVCLNCTGISIYDWTMQLIRPGATRMAELEADEEVQKVRQAIIQVKEIRFGHDPNG